MGSDGRSQQLCFLSYHTYMSGGVESCIRSHHAMLTVQGEPRFGLLLHWQVASLALSCRITLCSTDWGFQLGSSWLTGAPIHGSAWCASPAGILHHLRAFPASAAYGSLDRLLWVPEPGYWPQIQLKVLLRTSHKAITHTLCNNVVVYYTHFV